MKRFLVVILALALAVGLAGCGGETRPEDTVKAYCEALKASNFDEMGALKEKPVGKEDIVGDLHAEKMDVLYDYFKENAANIVYTIKDVKTEGGASKVTVEFKYVDASNIAQRGMQDFVLKAISMVLTPPTDEELQQAMNECFQNAIVFFKDAATTETVVFSCVKTEDKWKIGEISDGLVSVYTCNMNKALEDYGDLIG